VRRELKLRVNGEDYILGIEPHRTLLEVIRKELGLTGAKEGCGGGECGVCTVLLDGKAVKSCIMLAMDARGKEIWTIEGLARGGELHPLQRSFIEHGAIQCGYCTPGMIMSAKALLDKKPNPEEREIREAIAGNFCRCTGYLSIIEAIQAVSDSRKLV